VHPDGRSFLLEIVTIGDQNITKKFAQVRRAEQDNLILAISRATEFRKKQGKTN